MKGRTGSNRLKPCNTYHAAGFAWLLMPATSVMGLLWRVQLGACQAVALIHGATMQDWLG